jgi:2-C-methyl-D-erythritol 4-phosphate cytidylyltransferase/2-C-methyl-D-erythritol 2,4-cyclodiphosphate synthase
MPSSTPVRNGGTAALVVAAGRGNRAGRDLPKQYATLGGKTVLRRTLEAFASHPGIDKTLAVIAEADTPLYERAVQELSNLLPSVIGGATRQQSVHNGLEALAADPPRFVLVHDAARPFVSKALIDRVIGACDEGHGAIPVLPITDTVKRVENGEVTATVSRECLAAAQTPQGFPFHALLAAHRRAAAEGRENLTDDAAVAALVGLPVRTVESERRNLKLTAPDDFAAAERSFSARESRTGQGFDVHAFGPGHSVWLCGVEIPHKQGLLGHSDADVGIHALTDALLGTIGDGDIGHHFPPSDPQWKGAPSHLFLAEAVRRVAERGGRVVNVDVTLVCEQPKIGPHRDRMRARVAEIAGISKDRVGIKATTSEGLGFTGRGEGILALATATVSLPIER